MDQVSFPDEVQMSFVGAFLSEMGFSVKDLTYHLLPGDGSQRIFFRLSPALSKRTFILMRNSVKERDAKRENYAYLKIGKHLLDKGLPLPVIYRHDLDKGLFVMQDFGDVNLQREALEGSERIPLYRKVIDLLITMQIEGLKGFDTRWTCQTETYNRFVMRRYEVDYFIKMFLQGYLDVEIEWSLLEPAFDHIMAKASLSDSGFFLHRDFQSRNILIFKGRLGIIDWQGGRLGPLAYDLASLLIDPYTGLTTPEKRGLLRYYLKCVAEFNEIWAEQVARSYPYLAILRNLQILGAFAFLSQARKKKGFETYIPFALSSLKGLLIQLDDSRLDALRCLIDQLTCRHSDRK